MASDILVVDDEEDIREIVSGILSDEGHETRTAHDSDSALAAIADRYDGFVFDVWGTLYDGGAAYPQAVAVLQRLAAAGKAVVVLSNSPRPAAVVAGRLDGIGIPLHAGAEKFYREAGLIK